MGTAIQMAVLCQQACRPDSGGIVCRYDVSGNMVLAAGVIGGFLAYCSDPHCPGLGSWPEPIPVSIVTAIIQAKTDAGRSARAVAPPR